MIQETWHPTCQKKKYFSITSFSLNAFYFLLSSLVFPIHGEAVVTIRLTELEPVKPASRAMPVEVQDSADSLRASTSRVSPQNVSHQRIVFYLIGILLTATALAKLWMLLTDSFADIRVGIPKEILWLSVMFELWLAWQNFRIHDHNILALFNTVVFASLGVFATMRWMLGYRSCGCSGSIELPGWLFILIDFAIVGWFASSVLKCSQILAGWHHLWGEISSWSPGSRGRLAGLSLFVSLSIGLQLPFAAPMRAAVLGESPIRAAVKVEGELRLNLPGIATVEIWNRSSQPAKIIGFSSSCSCLDLVQDPVSKTIPAGQKLILQLAIKPNKVGPLRQRVELFLDHPKQFRVNVDVFDSIKGE
jgi:hypothetical protein